MSIDPTQSFKDMDLNEMHESLCFHKNTKVEIVDGGRRFYIGGVMGGPGVSMKTILNRFEQLTQADNLDKKDKEKAQKILGKLIKLDRKASKKYFKETGSSRLSLRQLNPFGQGKQRQMERIAERLYESNESQSSELPHAVKIQLALRSISKNVSVEEIEEALSTVGITEESTHLSKEDIEDALYEAFQGFEDSGSQQLGQFRTSLEGFGVFPRKKISSEEKARMRKAYLGRVKLPKISEGARLDSGCLKEIMGLADKEDFSNDQEYMLQSFFYRCAKSVLGAVAKVPDNASEKVAETDYYRGHKINFNNQFNGEIDQTCVRIPLRDVKLSHLNKDESKGGIVARFTSDYQGGKDCPMDFLTVQRLENALSEYFRLVGLRGLVTTEITTEADGSIEDLVFHWRYPQRLQ